MEELHDVIDVKPNTDGTLCLVFDNGQRGIFDMKPLFNKRPFDRLRQNIIFNQARIENGTVVWPGNIDIAPETLFDQLVPL